MNRLNLEPLARAVDIVELARQTGSQLKKSGKAWHSTCPLHGGDNPTAFVIWPETQTWRCFTGCGQGGDAVDLVMRWKGFEFIEAIRWLADVLRMQQCAGLRLDEAIHVRLDRIDFEQGTIEVKGKGGKIRCVTLTDRTVLDLLDRSRRYPLLNGLASNWKRYIEKLVCEACRELRIKPLGTHAFRAGAAQRLFDDLTVQGMNERQARKQISQMLGHNRISVTRSYAP